MLLLSSLTALLGLSALAPIGSAARAKSCPVTGGTTDDSKAILAAVTACNNLAGGGSVVLDGTYTIASPLDLRNLKSVDLVITGTITFNGVVSNWAGKLFDLNFQNAQAYWLIGGQDVNIIGQGKGTININGKSFQGETKRPVGLAISGLTGGSVTGLNFKNPGFWYNWIAFSKNVVYDNININGSGANTDGWDIYNSDHITITNSVVVNGDDCISFKPNSTNIFVSQLSCTGSHGVSVGSLGQYPGIYDVVQNVYVKDVTCTNCQHGARIKVWPGAGAGATSGGLSGGGGSGLVKNVTFDGFTVKGGDQDALLVTACYGQSKVDVCTANPSTFKIQDVFFKGITGDVKGKNQAVGSIICPSATSCSNINVSGLGVTSQSGKYNNQLVCDNIDITKILAPATCHA
ncbi:glycoside hydrolase family 28 protein [Gonapodya prolifera JEL478]|uniref:Glycoside hydrolase family 28 protein n=1 Tax=Gonapodya prolifera (strain JEL478) TaxID=1344416 RepID=A0A139A539_GONPJ|nr:glycoside hydrolase family 28 protein [Gonapodya prolifera JEL478]|eukprot:KXS11851.1 glycoside hydrolase family 28 protein [Gonapodya prolifera JEL478]